jgi:hypothetical protein
MCTNVGGSIQNTLGSNQDSPLCSAVCEKLILRLVLRAVDTAHDYNRLPQALVHPKPHGTQAKCICIAWLPHSIAIPQYISYQHASCKMTIRETLNF